MIERRRYIRFNAPVPVEYRTLTLNPIFGKTLAKDLSREGLRFGLEVGVPAGTPMELYLNVPGDNLPVFAIGKVAWADGLEGGVKLTRISEPDRKRVLGYVYREWVKARKRLRMSAG
ncbi:MAG: PilZ domain-containing protein [Candidatus Omnitrophota bacterium]